MDAWNMRNNKIIANAGASLKLVASTLFSRKRYFKNCIITKDVSISCQFEIAKNICLSICLVEANYIRIKEKNIH